MSKLSILLHTVFLPAHLRRTLLITLLVGSWLTAFNLGDVLITDPVNSMVLIKIGLNYLTPFLVANLGLLSHRE
jgi:hypothetical protein